MMHRVNQLAFQRLILSLVVLGLSSHMGSVEASYSCVPYNRSDLISPCSYYNPSDYAYLDLSETSLEAQLAYMQGWITGLSALVSNTACKDWAVAWACQEPRVSPTGLIQSMRCCAVDPLGALVEPPTYVPACRDMCDTYYALCKPVLDAAGLGQYFPSTFCDDYTNDGIVYQGVEIPCYNITPGNQSSAPLDCPDGMSPSGTRCQPNCPSPEYSSTQVFDLGLMQQIVAWISFVSTALLIITFGIFPRLREFPNRIVLFLLLSTMPISLAFMLATFVGGNVGDVWCGDTESFSASRIGGDTSQNADQRAIATGGLCIFQSWLIVWGTLATGIWWLLLIANSTYIILMSRRFTQASTSLRLEVCYHLLAWGLPTILVIIPTAAGKMDYESTNVFCFISSANGQGWRIGCWFVPMGIIVVTGFVGLAVSTYFLIIAKGKVGLRTFVVFRLCCAFLIILITSTLFLAFLIFSASELESNLISIYSYLVCIVARSSESACRDELYAETSLLTNYNLGMAATFFACALGFLLCLFTASSSAFLKSVKSATSDSRSNSQDSHRTAEATSGHSNRDALD